MIRISRLKLTGEYHAVAVILGLLDPFVKLRKAGLQCVGPALVGLHENRYIRLPLFDQVNHLLVVPIALFDVAGENRDRWRCLDTSLKTRDLDRP